jgi:hypothetical protein
VLSTHPIPADELRARRRLQGESQSSPFVYVSERGSPFTTAGFARMIERAAAGAGLELKGRTAHATPRLRLGARLRATTPKRFRAGSAIGRLLVAPVIENDGNF